MKHICRICLNEKPALNFVACKKDESSQIKMQLSMFVPEMVVDLVKNPVFCQSCASTLHTAHNFKSLCLQTEQHILNYSSKILSNKSIDIKDLLYDLQLSTRNSVCEDNGEDENTRKESFTITPNMNLLLLDEDLVNGQNFNSECNTGQHSPALLNDAAEKINNANNVTATAFSKPAIQVTADDPLRITPIQSPEIKQEGENGNEDIIIKEEDLTVPKMESLLSAEGFEEKLFEDTESEDHTAEVKNIDNESVFLQSNRVAQNCCVKLTRFSDGISYKCNSSLDDSLQNAQSRPLVLVNEGESVNRDIKIEEETRIKHKGVLTKQNKNHGFKNRFSCASCKYHTVYKHALIKHIRTHTGEKPFACNVCTFRSSQKSGLQNHLRIHTGEKPFACNVCTYRSSEKSSLRKHLRIHTGEKPFACNMCNLCFAQKSHLQNHVLVHTGEKPFGCSMCTIRFARKYNLQKHLRIHTGEKPFACDVCSFRFAQKWHLQNHLRVHTGEKPFVCNVCSFRSAQKTHLQQHLRIHTGEKSFACNVCNYRSAQKSNLQQHLQTHSEEKAFSCNICNSAFSQESSLRRHMKKQHQNPTLVAITVNTKKS